MNLPFSPWLMWLIDTAIALLLLAMLLVVVRLWQGPDATDRLLALDTLYLNAAALLLVWDLKTTLPYLFEAALMIAGLGFVSTAAAARFLARRRIVE